MLSNMVSGLWVENQSCKVSFSIVLIPTETSQTHLLVPRTF